MLLRLPVTRLVLTWCSALTAQEIDWNLLPGTSGEVGGKRSASSQRWVETPATPPAPPPPLSLCSLWSCRWTSGNINHRLSRRFLSSAAPPSTRTRVSSVRDALTCTFFHLSSSLMCDLEGPTVRRKKKKHDRDFSQVPRFYFFFLICRVPFRTDVSGSSVTSAPDIFLTAMRS